MGTDSIPKVRRGARICEGGIGLAYLAACSQVLSLGLNVERNTLVGAVCPPSADCAHTMGRREFSIMDDRRKRVNGSNPERALFKTFGQ